MLVKRTQNKTQPVPRFPVSAVGGGDRGPSLGRTGPAKQSPGFALTLQGGDT